MIEDLGTFYIALIFLLSLFFGGEILVTPKPKGIPLLIPDSLLSLLLLRSIIFY